MAVVVSTFVASLWYSQVTLGPVQQDALSITADAAPSLEHLASARAELFRLQTQFAEELSADSVFSVNVREIAGRLHDQIAAYAALPPFPGEERHVSAIRDAEERLIRSLDRLLQHRPAGANASTEFRTSSEELAAALRSASEYNVTQLRKSAAAIIGARRTAGAAALGFGLLSVIAAAVATFLAARIIREQARLAAERRRVLEVRAAELEAFAGRVAHDLKNPLHTIALQSALASRLRGIPPQTRESFDHITRQISRMNGIIDGLLTFACAAANPDRSARTRLPAAIEGVLEEVREDACRRGVALAVGPVPDCSVACSEGVLSSVLSNLLTNGIKYMDDGSTERRVSIRGVLINDKVRVFVEDTGPGLPAGSESTVFDPFVRLHRGCVPGLGLGLATVKRLIEAHEGRVGVESSPGRGARFWFELPATRNTDLPVVREPAA